MRKIQRPDYFWLAFYAFIAGIIALAVFGPRKAVERYQLDCTPLVSIDGTKELQVFEDGAVILWDDATKDEHGKFTPIDGRWDFNKTTKLYAITLNGKVTAYSLVMPKVGPCMLVNGDLGTADLRTSWFSKY